MCSSALCRPKTVKKRRQCKKTSSEENLPSAYEGFCPLWDRKWLFEEELWTFEPGMRDKQFYNPVQEAHSRAVQTRREREQKQKATEAKYAALVPYPTRSKVKINHSKDVIEDDVLDSDVEDLSRSSRTESSSTKSKSGRAVAIVLATNWDNKKDKEKLQELEKLNYVVYSVNRIASQSKHPRHVEMNFKGARALMDLQPIIARHSDAEIVVILDYAWLPQTYYEMNYGTDWLSTKVPLLFSIGATKIFLPKDLDLSPQHLGGMSSMLANHTQMDKIKPSGLKIRHTENDNENPLYVATENYISTLDMSNAVIRSWVDNVNNYTEPGHRFILITQVDKPTTGSEHPVFSRRSISFVGLSNSSSSSCMSSLSSSSSSASTTSSSSATGTQQAP